MQTPNETQPFVSCDWGTSHFRLRWVGAPVPTEFRSDDGAGKLAALGGDRAEHFRTTLTRGLEKLQAPSDLPVIISGMASSSIGWRELPYASLPFPLDGGGAIWEQMDDRTLLISGLRSDTDMLRGEETQALGLAKLLGADLPSAAVMVLPGTHSKHVETKAGCIIGIRTFMTGELFALLSRQSVLRHSTDPAAPFDRGAFVEGVEQAQRQPLPAVLFRVRTRQVLDRQDAPSNTSFLSGLLIGSELAALKTVNRTLILASSEPLCTAYSIAAATLGLGASLHCVDSENLASLGQAVFVNRIPLRK